MSKSTRQIHADRINRLVDSINSSMMNMFKHIANEHDLNHVDRIRLLFKMFNMVANVATEGRRNMKKLFMEATKNGN